MRMNHQSHIKTGLTADTSHDIRNIGRQKSKMLLHAISDFRHLQESIPKSEGTMTLEELDITKEKVPSLRFDKHRHDSKIRKAHTGKEIQATSDKDCTNAMRQRNSSLHKAPNRVPVISNLSIEDLESLDNSYSDHEFLNLESEFLVPVKMDKNEPENKDMEIVQARKQHEKNDIKSKKGAIEVCTPQPSYYDLVVAEHRNSLISEISMDFMSSLQDLYMKHRNSILSSVTIDDLGSIDDDDFSDDTCSETSSLSLTVSHHHK